MNFFYTRIVFLLAIFFYAQVKLRIERPQFDWISGFSGEELVRYLPGFERFPARDRVEITKGSNLITLALFQKHKQVGHIEVVPMRL